MNSSTSNLVLAADAAIDLHLHTTFSDGTWTPAQLLDHLAQAQFGLVAITDHDRPDTAEALQQLAQEKDQPLLIGVEMSTVWQDELTDQRRDQLSGLLEMTDLLCYGFNPEGQALHNIAQDLWRRQRENTQEVYENLLQQGYRFPQDPDALASIFEKPALRQPHELAALLKKYDYGIGEPSAGRILLEAGCIYALNNLAAVVDAAHQDGVCACLPTRGTKRVALSLMMLKCWINCARKFPWMAWKSIIPSTLLPKLRCIGNMLSAIIC